MGDDEPMPADQALQLQKGFLERMKKINLEILDAAGRAKWSAVFAEIEAEIASLKAMISGEVDGQARR